MDEAGPPARGARGGRGATLGSVLRGLPERWTTTLFGDEAAGGEGGGTRSRVDPCWIRDATVKSV